MNAYGKPPEAIAEFEIPEWDEFMHYLYLPVKMPYSNYRLPPNLAFLRPVLTAVYGDQSAKWYNSAYFYVTARRGYATPENPLNRPGWHCDGFGSDDLNYIWWDRWGTRFSEIEFPNISDDHIKSLRQFEDEIAWHRQHHSSATAWKTYPDKTLYRLDRYVVHNTPIVPAPGGMRSFLKISVSEHRYNLVGNTHNYLFDYDWKMYPRDILRNDPARAGLDYLDEP